MKKGFCVRLGVFANEGDYILFSLCINTLFYLTNGKVYLEDNEFIEAPTSFFDGKWVESQIKSDFEMVRTIVYQHKTPKSEFSEIGLIGPYCTLF